MIRTSRLAKLLAISFALTFAARAAATAEISVIPLGPITARGVPASFLLYLTDTNVTAPLCDRVAYDGTIGYGDGHQEAFTGGPSLALAPISRQFQHAYQYGSPAATVTLTATTDHYEPWDWIDLGPAGVIPIPGLCLTHTETEVQTFTETAPVLFLGQVSVDINGLADGSPGLAFSVYQGATACFQASVRGTLTDDPVSYSWSLQPGCDACRTLLPMIQGEPTPEQVAYEESVRAACAACGPQYGPVPGASFCRTFPDLGVWDVLAVAAPIYGIPGFTRATVAVVEPPPLEAFASAPGAVECTENGGGRVSLDGSGSVGRKAPIVEYRWVDETGAVLATGSGPTAEVWLPLGAHTLALTVTDGAGRTATTAVQANVQDTQPPVLAVGADVTCLWPPNHKPRLFTLADVGITAVDACDPSPVGFLRSIEVHAEAGAASTAATDVDFVAGSAAFCVDVERPGESEGRAYVLSISALDSSCNVATSVTWEVQVPHDMGVGPCATKATRAGVEVEPDSPLCTQDVTPPACAPPDVVARAAAQGCSAGGAGWLALLLLLLLLAVLAPPRQSRSISKTLAPGLPTTP